MAQKKKGNKMVGKIVKTAVSGVLCIALAGGIVAANVLIPPNASSVQSILGLKSGEIDNSKAKTEGINMEYSKPGFDTLDALVEDEVALNKQIAAEGIVLLKNNGILPLNESDVKTIAVIGPNADSRTALEGNYNGTADRYVTFLEGIEDRFSGRVLYAEGCHLYKDRVSGLAKSGDRYAEAEAAAANSDVVILCLGLDATIEGEEGDTGNEFSSGDKNDLRLPESQRILAEKITALGKPVIIVCAAGSSINTEVCSDALIHAWYPGSEGGKALADIIFGDISPSGKLPVTFYETAEKLPDFTDYSMKNRTYRYTPDNILFPFGYGLTYGNVKVTALEYKCGKASVTAVNHGRTTEDVIELYIKAHDGNATPNPCLCGFKRIYIRENEEITFDITLSEKAFTVINENGERIRPDCGYTLYAGTHQPDMLSTSLCGSDCVNIEITSETEGK